MRSFAALLITLCLATVALAAEPRSGLQVGDDVLPFTSNVVTGPNRGQQHCYVCELKADQPAILVFARGTDPATAKLMVGLRDTVRRHAGANLFGWFVFLGGKSTAAQLELEKTAEAFTRKNAATRLAVTYLGDPAGPPGYRIAPDAVVTLLMFRGGLQGHVLANKAYSTATWNMKAAQEALSDLTPLALR
ncbi:MAG: hypothetical protein FJX76_05085 [Armatimonadetes bacterium]|nr:hypothetical protein [Armatimonadota bacterium]